MRNFVPIVLFVLIVAANSFAAPNVLRAAAAPDPGVLVAIGGGLVGIATLIRRHLGD